MRGNQIQRKRREGDAADSTHTSAPGGRSVQLRGMGMEEQLRTLSPDHQPDVGDQAASMAPVQMRGGEHDGAIIPEYDYKSIEIRDIEITNFDVSVDATVTLKHGKEVITTEIDATTDIFDDPKMTMMGIVGAVDEKLSARGKKRLLTALVRAFKKAKRKQPKDDDGGDE